MEQSNIGVLSGNAAHRLVSTKYQALGCYSYLLFIEIQITKSGLVFGHTFALDTLASVYCRSYLPADQIFR